jgi:hypothetical protein
MCKTQTKSIGECLQANENKIKLKPIHYATDGLSPPREDILYCIARGLIIQK